jgi:hypothetical protein
MASKKTESGADKYAKKKAQGMKVVPKKTVVSPNAAKQPRGKKATVDVDSLNKKSQVTADYEALKKLGLSTIESISVSLALNGDTVSESAQKKAHGILHEAINETRKRGDDATADALQVFHTRLLEKYTVLGDEDFEERLRVSQIQEFVREADFTEDDAATVKEALLREEMDFNEVAQKAHALIHIHAEEYDTEEELTALANLHTMILRKYPEVGETDGADEEELTRLFFMCEKYGKIFKEQFDCDDKSAKMFSNLLADNVKPDGVEPFIKSMLKKVITLGRGSEKGNALLELTRAEAKGRGIGSVLFLIWLKELEEEYEKIQEAMNEKLDGKKEVRKTHNVHITGTTTSEHVKFENPEFPESHIGATIDHSRKRVLFNVPGDLAKGITEDLGLKDIQKEVRRLKFLIGVLHGAEAKIQERIRE